MRQATNGPDADRQRTPEEQAQMERDLKLMQMCSRLEISPQLVGHITFKTDEKLVGHGTDKNPAWQVMERYDGSLDKLLTQDICSKPEMLKPIVKSIEDQLQKMFEKMAKNNLFCYDLKLQNTVYKLVPDEHDNTRCCQVD
jgi:hypothetical protein